ncbi:hypothetical protein BDY19DRAFT_975842 [Irpex rosettiformis]|uniref:Uncharacterized protein n=1 Tax=Irpex rosettiformis TaxID=378272 RepID=A0ACB8TP30_9APHY|nr:hypothetical protein BDY19DRAFT_975842 [Irpex rosettiformis]
MLSSIRYFSQSSIHRFPRLSRNVASRIPTFRERVAAAKPFKQFKASIPQPSIRNQILFTLCASSALFVYAANQTNQDTYLWLVVARERGKALFRIQPSNSDLHTLKKNKLVKDAQAAYDNLMTRLQSWPLRLRHDASWLYVQIAQPILNANEGKRVAWGLVGLSSVTWLLWKWPRAMPFMRKSFCHNPLSGRSYTLLTSMFSHQSFMHLAFNSLALSACGSTVVLYLAQPEGRGLWKGGLPEADTSWHVLAFFVSAGLFASLVSHTANAKWVFPRVIKASTAASTAPRTTATLVADTKAASRKVASVIRPSLGISGAVYAGMVLTALAYPQAVANLVFLPIFPIPIQWAVGACVAFDIYGLIRGLQFFDHYAHLGGALFGALYYLYGREGWDWLRVFLMVLDGHIKPQNLKKDEPKP